MQSIKIILLSCIGFLLNAMNTQDRTFLNVPLNRLITVHNKSSVIGLEVQCKCSMLQFVLPGKNDTFTTIKLTDVITFIPPNHTQEITISSFPETNALLTRAYEQIPAYEQQKITYSNVYIIPPHITKLHCYDTLEEDKNTTNDTLILLIQKTT